MKHGKSIFLIGDSITANGNFLGYVRMQLQREGNKIFLHNKGIPGGTTELFLDVIEEEMQDFVPEYALISFGANDIGYWEYNLLSLGTDSLKKIKEERQRAYIKSLSLIVDKLEQRGVKVILSSPFCMNKYLSAKENIKTVVDLKEKREIDYGFYNEKVFCELNKALCDLGHAIKDLAEERGLEFWDIFAQTYENVREDSFEEDGIHYSQKGNELIAELIFKNLTNGSLVISKIDRENEAILKRELEERTYYFVKYNLLRKKSHGLNDSELCSMAEKWIEENGNIFGFTKKRQEYFFQFVKDHQKKQSSLINDIRKMK